MSRPLTFAAVTFVATSGLIGLACTSDGTGADIVAQTSPPVGDGGAGASSCPDERPASCPNPAPSWATDVAPIFSGYCAYCHGPNGIAATVDQFTTYDVIYGDRQAILDQVNLCRMPTDAGIPLPEDLRATLLTWLVCGAPNN
jgi:hypothetical protein